MLPRPRTRPGSLFCGRIVLFSSLLALGLSPGFADESSGVILFQDNFGGTLNSRWQIQSNNGSLYGFGANGVTLHCCYYDMWPGNNSYYNLFLVTNPAPQDFILTLKCQWITPPSRDWGQIALVAYDSDTNYVRVDSLGSNGGTRYLEVLAAVDGSNAHDEFSVKNFGTGPFWLQMRKQQTNFSSWFSTDGISFTKTNAAIVYTNGPSTKLGFIAMADTNQTAVVLVSSFTIAVPAPGAMGIRLTGGQAGVQLVGTVGSTYRVQFTTNVLSPNWITRTNLTLPSSPFLYLDAAALQTNEAGFYRSVLIP